MKKVFSLLITLAMLISTVAVPMSVSADTTAWDGETIAEGFAGGTGTEADPYLISNGAELAYLAEKVWNATTDETMTSVIKAGGYVTDCYNVYTGTYFKLTADIDLGSKEWKPIGRHGARFNGNFDGAGHVVKNISITKPYIGIGLFGATSKQTKISNLGVENVSISIDSEVSGNSKLEETNTFGATADGLNYIWGSGAMVGFNGGGTYEYCYTKDVTFYNKSNGINGGGVGEAGFGGFAGNDNAIERGDGVTATYNSCYVMNVTATSAGYAAGFMSARGSSSYTEVINHSINNCYVAGEINLAGRDGKTGFSNRGTASNCYSVSDLAMASEVATVGATKKTIVDNISVASGFVADNAKAAINDGYPVLSWQADWIWDGTVATGFAGGSGTKDDPYLISNGAELAYLSEKVYNAVDNKTKTHLDTTVPIVSRNNKEDSSAACVTSEGVGLDYYDVYMDTYFKLTADIDLGNQEWQPIGRLGARFAGKFDGNGHVVKNVSITKTYQTIGFFGATGGTYTSAVEVKNFGVEGINIDVNANGDYSSGKILDWKEYAPTADTAKWLWCSGGMVGTVGGGTFTNCYVKDVKFDSGCGTGEGGFGGFFGNPRATYQRMSLNATNCYVMNVEAHARDAAGGFLFANEANQGLGKMDITLTNCYVGGTVILSRNYNVSTGACTAFARSTVGNNSFTVVNCYTTGTVFNSDKLSATSTKEQIVAGIASVDGWYEDNSTSPINGGYPILDWQNTWKRPYEVKAVTTAEGYVTGVTLKQNENVSGTVIVAVYSGDRFVGAVTATAAAGEVDITDIAAETGNVVKVFVWDSLSALNPVAYEYATTL